MSTMDIRPDIDEPLELEYKSTPLTSLMTPAALQPLTSLSTLPLSLSSGRAFSSSSSSSTVIAPAKRKRQRPFESKSEAITSQESKQVETRRSDESEPRKMLRFQRGNNGNGQELSEVKGDVKGVPDTTIEWFFYPYNGVQFAYRVPKDRDILLGLQTTAEKAQEYIKNLNLNLDQYYFIFYPSIDLTEITSDDDKNQSSKIRGYRAYDFDYENALDWIKIFQYLNQTKQSNQHSQELFDQVTQVLNPEIFNYLYPGNPHQEFRYLQSTADASVANEAKQKINPSNYNKIIEYTEQAPQYLFRPWPLTSDNVQPIEGPNIGLVYLYSSPDTDVKATEDENLLELLTSSSLDDDNDSSVYCGDMQMAWELAAAKTGERLTGRRESKREGKLSSQTEQQQQSRQGRYQRQGNFTTCKAQAIKEKNLFKNLGLPPLKPSPQSSIDTIIQLFEEPRRIKNLLSEIKAMDYFIETRQQEIKRLEQRLDKQASLTTSQENLQGLIDKLNQIENTINTKQTELENGLKYRQQLVGSMAQLHA